MDLKKCLVSTLAAATLLGATTVGAFQNESYGSRSFKTVSVPMDGSVVGRVVMADDVVVSDQPAADIINANANGLPVTAAINGLFFASYYKPNQPITFPGNTPLILSNVALNGLAVVGNGKTNSIGFTQDGKVLIDVVDMRPRVFVDDAALPVYVWSVNQQNNNTGAVMYFTDRMTLPYSIQPGSVGYLAQNDVVTQELYGGSVTLAPGQSLLVINAGANDTVPPHVGSVLHYKTDYISDRGVDWSQMTSMTGGGRMLVYGGAVVSADPSFNQALDYDPKQNATGVAMRSFAAVMNDGTLLLGTGTGSFNEIAQFLQGKGAVDAISLDGGASSMLYENGSFVTPAGRELASILMFTAKPVPVGPTAIAQPCKALVDGQAVTMDAYNIENNNYVKLRDLACAITRYSDSPKAFNVEWNNDVRAVELTSGKKYQELSGELSLSQGQNVPDVPLSTDPIYMDGAKVDTMKAYKINGANYVKLRDVYRAFDIQVGWDNASRTVLIDTASSYAE